MFFLQMTDEVVDEDVEELSAGDDQQNEEGLFEGDAG